MEIKITPSAKTDRFNIMLEHVCENGDASACMIRWEITIGEAQLIAEGLTHIFQTAGVWHTARTYIINEGKQDETRTIDSINTGVRPAEEQELCDTVTEIASRLSVVELRVRHLRGLHDRVAALEHTIFDQAE